MRVLTILVRHGSEQYAHAEHDVAELFRTQLPHVERSTIVVDTARAPGVLEPGADRVLIGADNSSWEFSGFDAGLAYAGDAVWDFDLVNLATSAFRQLYAGYLERFRPDVLQSIIGRAVCLGHIDCYNESVEVEGCASQHWVRSSCLFIPPLELKILGTLVSAGSRERWFGGNPGSPFRDDSPLSSTYKRLIIDWLTGQDIGQGVTWHSAMGLEAASLARFEAKATAILNEHLLGIRLRAAGCRTIDVTWLSGILARQSPAAVDWTTPWWRQLADRDRDAVHVQTSPRIA